METEVVFEPGYEGFKASGAILIEGLPGVGLVAKVAVAYLLEKLGGARICRFYSPYFPTVCYVRDGRLIPSFADLYYVERPKPLLLLYGNAQPASYYGQHEFCEKILMISERIGASFVITLGGYGKEEVDKVRKVYISSTRKGIIDEALKKLDASIYDGQIIGVAGLLITMAGERGIKNVSLLVEAGGMTPDLHAAKRAVEAVTKLLDLDLIVEDVYSFSRIYLDALRKFEA